MHDSYGRQAKLRRSTQGVLNAYHKRETCIQFPQTLDNFANNVFFLYKTLVFVIYKTSSPKFATTSLLVPSSYTMFYVNFFQGIIDYPEIVQKKVKLES